MQVSPRTPLQRKYFVADFFAFGLLTIHVLLLLWMAWCHSPTVSEGLSCGVIHWKLGRFEPCCRNPPLVRLLAAIPLALWIQDDDWLRQVRLSEPVATSNVVWFPASYASQLPILFFIGRLVCVAISVLGGAVCYIWAKEWFGPWAGLMALALWCFSPETLANNALVMPDGPAAAFGVWASYCFWRWLRYGGWSIAWWASVALSAAVLSKACWLPMFGAWPLMWLVVRLGSREFSWSERLRQLGQLAAIIVLAILGIDLCYGFQGVGMRLDQCYFESDLLRRVAGDHPTVEVVNDKPLLRTTPGLFGWVPSPFPKLFLVGLDVQRRVTEQGRPNWVWGRRYERGQFHHYVLAMAVKVPVAMIFLLGLAVPIFVRLQNCRRPWRDELCLCAPVLLLLIFLMLNTGVRSHFRYLLPAAPFTFIFMSRVVHQTLSPGPLMSKVVCGLLSWLIVSSLFVFPHSMSYCNELVGGPLNGYRYLLGATYLDRDQDDYYLERWVQAHPEKQPILYTFSEREPVRYISRENLLPGWYAISINHLITTEAEPTVWYELDPKHRVGYTIFIYYISPDECVLCSESLD